LICSQTWKKYTITIHTEQVSKNKWRGHATIESIPPTAEMRLLEISSEVEFETQGQAYREIKKLAETRIPDSF
jgi:hypothetical protein